MLLSILQHKSKEVYHPSNNLEQISKNNLIMIFEVAASIWSICSAKQGCRLKTQATP